MKLKNVLLTLGLALGVGAGVGAAFSAQSISQNKPIETSAAYCPSEIYLKWTDCQWYWWSQKANNPANAHFWYNDGTQNIALGNDVAPTVLEFNSTVYYKYVVPAGAQYVMWYMAGWGESDQNKMSDQAIPSNGHNLFVMNTWNDNAKQSGYWDERELSDTIDNGFFLRGDWGSDDSTNWGWRAPGQLGMSSVNNKHTYTGLTLSANGRIKIVNYVNHLLSEWITPDVIDVDGEFTAANDDSGNTYVSAAGVYNVALYWDGSTCHIELSGGPNVSLDAAIGFAEDFVAAMNANCPYTANGKTSSDVSDTWEDQMTAYAALLVATPGAEKFLTTADGATSDDILDLWSSYDYIYGHYKSVRDITDANFLGRDISISASYSYVSQMVSQENNASIMIIVAASAIVVLGIGAFCFYRRKEN